MACGCWLSTGMCWIRLNWELKLRLLCTNLYPQEYKLEQIDALLANHHVLGVS